MLKSWSETIRSDRGEVMWDAPIQTIEEERAYRPDIFFNDNQMKKAYMLEIAVNLNRQVLERAAKKRENMLTSRGKLSVCIMGSQFLWCPW